MEPPEPEEEAPPRIWETEEYKRNEKNIAERLRLGRQYFVAGEYDQAQEMFEGVLKRDAHNSEAIRLMEKVTQKKYDRASMELEATRKGMMVEVRKAWNPRDYGLLEQGKDAWGQWIGRQKGKPVEETQRLKILARMDNIKIPEIDFRQANIHDVVNFLQEASVEFDKSDVRDESKGVNIILNLKSGRPASEPADIFLETEGVPGLDEGEMPLVTFSARHISLLEALKLVTSIGNLKYRVEGSVVMIVPIDAPEGEIIYRMYDVLPSVGDKIAALGPEVGTTRRRRTSARQFVSIDEGGTGTERADWKEFFAEMGVPWPTGSSIKYIPAIGRIVVANTADNLTIFETILAALNVVPNQIEIEARFVEVLQRDLESLGF